MLTRPLPPNPTLSDRFAWLVQGLYDAMGYEWRRRGMGHAMQTAISFRVIGLVRRLYAVLAKWRAGTLRPPRVRAGDRAASTPHADAPPQAKRERAKSLLPRRAGWLRRLLPDSAGAMNAFSDLLVDPEMKAILAAAPQVGRILRPLWHFLGLPLPAELMLAKRARVRTNNGSARPSPALGEAEAAELRRLTARFPDTPPARAAKRALARSLAGLPVDPTKLSAVAYGYYVHPPRDEHCPPPEIGYARSRVRVPKDYEGWFKKWD